MKILSRCCNAEVEISGGGYDDDYIVPITDRCSKCGKKCEIKPLIGRPPKMPF